MSRGFVKLLFLLLLPLLGCAATTAPEENPVLPPPAFAEIQIESGGDRMHGLIYLAAGPGPHPTVVLLHGYPGNERNLDLAQAIRRAGANALYFNYRGSWGSAGTFTTGSALEDVAAVLAYLRGENGRELRVDPQRLVLVGHSYGAYLAAMGTANDPDVRCTVFMSGLNIGTLGKQARENEELAAIVAATLGSQMDPRHGPLRGDGTTLVQELIDRADELDLTAHVDAITSRPLLMIAGEHDMVLARSQHHDPLIAAFRAGTGTDNVTEMIFDDDHAMSGHRLELADTVIGWLRDECGVLDPGGR